MSLTELRAQRAHACRLTRDRALRSLDEAEGFLRDRRILTLVADSALPSLFGAIHEEGLPGKSGFGSWPKTKWPWGGELASRPGVRTLKIHVGKLVFLTPEALSIVDPLCREALAQAEDGSEGEVAAAFARHLAAAGPSSLDDLKAELDLEPRTLRSAREKLERVGAVVSRGTVVPAEGAGHRHSSELARWDQVHGVRRKVSPAAALEDLIALGVRAAVVAHEDEARKWFSWPVERDVIARLLASGRLRRAGPGWLAAP